MNIFSEIELFSSKLIVFWIFRCTKTFFLRLKPIQILMNQKQRFPQHRDLLPYWAYPMISDHKAPHFTVHSLHLSKCTLCNYHCVSSCNWTIYLQSQQLSWRRRRSLGRSYIVTDRFAAFLELLCQKLGALKFMAYLYASVNVFVCGRGANFSAATTGWLPMKWCSQLLLSLT